MQYTGCFARSERSDSLSTWSPSCAPAESRSASDTRRLDAPFFFRVEPFRFRVLRRRRAGPVAAPVVGVAAADEAADAAVPSEPRLGLAAASPAAAPPSRSAFSRWARWTSDSRCWWCAWRAWWTPSGVIVPRRLRCRDACGPGTHHFDGARKRCRSFWQDGNDETLVGHLDQAVYLILLRPSEREELPHPPTTVHGLFSELESPDGTAGVQTPGKFHRCREVLEAIEAEAVVEKRQELLLAPQLEVVFDGVIQPGTLPLA